MKYDWTFINSSLRDIAEGQSFEISCPPGTLYSTFVQTIRVRISRHNLDYGTKIRVSQLREQKAVQIINAGTITATKLSAHAESLLRDLSIGRATIEGRDYLRDEFQRLLNAYKERIDANRAPVELPVDTSADHMARRKAEATDKLRLETAIMTEPINGASNDGDELHDIPSAPFADDEEVPFI